MSWADRAYLVMCEVRIASLQAGKTPPEIVEAINDAYPFGERKGWPYKAWLRERKAFFIRHGLPFKKPSGTTGDLFGARAVAEKPLFIPLKRRHFESFEKGYKGEEFRPEGPRWNALTCRVGRPVVLSLGYGKASRLYGVIISYRSSFDATQSEEWANCYPERVGKGKAACIGIEIHMQHGEVNSEK